eukprot:Nk52_evm3s309 gene=Nk52_evmTU3s309
MSDASFLEVSVGSQLKECEGEDDYIAHLSDLRVRTRDFAVSRMLKSAAISESVLQTIKNLAAPVLVTGSAGHLGAALVAYLRAIGISVVGVDLIASSTTDFMLCVSDKAKMKEAGRGCRSVIHTAALHAPHMRFYSDAMFEKVNVEGTRVVLSIAQENGMNGIVFSSTTSLMNTELVKERALKEQVILSIGEDYGKPRNIYGNTKLAAEAICLNETNINVAILRCSRFFVEDKVDTTRGTNSRSEKGKDQYSLGNDKANELLSGTRVALEDLVHGHLVALAKLTAPAAIGNSESSRMVIGPLLMSGISPLLPDGRSGNDCSTEDQQKDIVDQVQSSLLYQENDWKAPEKIARKLYNSKAAWEELGISPCWDISFILNKWKSKKEEEADLRTGILQGLY